MATIVNVDDLITFAMPISLANTVVHADDGHRRARTRRHQPAWSATIITDHLRYEIGVFYTRQTVAEVEGEIRPANGHAFATSAMLAWDAYEWHDLTPRGFLLTIAAIPAVFVGPSLPQNRFQAELELKAAERLTRYTAVMLRVFAGVMARGNPNHSLTLGSVAGVRGLEDAWFFNWAQA